MTRSGAGPILWLSGETPSDTGQGGQRRQFAQLSGLVEHDLAVVVATSAGAQDDARISELFPTHRVRHRRLTGVRPDVRRLVADLSPRAVVVAHAESWPFGHWVPRGIPIWWDLHNINSRFHELRGDPAGASASARVERDIVARASRASVCSARELEALTAISQPGPDQTVIMPNGISAADWPAPQHAPRPMTVGAFGSWWYPPNIDGMRLFLDEVWPRVIAAAPLARLEIAGIGTPPASAHPSVRPVGQVGDVAAFLGSCAVVALPLKHGAGTPVKFAEALASGRPVVVTEDGRTDLAPDDDFAITPDAQTMAAAIVDLLDNPAIADRRGARGRARALSTLTWEAVNQPLVSWLAEQTRGQPVRARRR